MGAARQSASAAPETGANLRYANLRTDWGVGWMQWIGRHKTALLLHEPATMFNRWADGAILVFHDFADRLVGPQAKAALDGRIVVTVTGATRRTFGAAKIWPGCLG